MVGSGRKHLTSVGQPLAVRVARSIEEVQTLRSSWTSLLEDSIHTDPEYFLWSLDAEPHVVRPHVLAVERNGRVEAVVAARLADITLPCRFGRTTVYAPKLRAICVMREGLLGRADAETTAAVVRELLAALERREADVLLFRQLEHGSALHGAAMARATLATRRQHSARSDVHWQIQLPATMEHYLASVSASTRKGIRRTGSRLERRYGGRLSVEVFRDPSELEAALGDVEQVAAKTYQRRLGVGYVGDARQQTRLRFLAARGWFRAYVLYLDGSPIAFELGELYRGRFHSLAGAYDPAHGPERVGAYLLLEAIADLIAEGVSIFDFGFGDAEYKGKLAHRRFEEGDLVLYARRARPFRIKLARTVVLELSRAVTTWLGRAALLDRLKHRARRPQPAAVLARTAR